MNFLSRFRLPFREDALLSVLAFTILVVPLAFSPVFYEKFEIPKWALWLVLTGCAFLVFFIRSRNETEQTHTWTTNKGLAWLLGLLLLTGVVSTIWSVNKLNSLIGFYPRFSNGLLFYFIWASGILLLVSVFTRAKFFYIVQILSFDALCISLFGIIQSLGIAYYEGVGEPAGLLRGPSLLGNANFSAMFLAMVLPLTLYALLQTSRKSARVYYGFVILSMLFASIILSSRGALLALGASLTLFFLGSVLFRLGKKFILTSLTVLLLAGALWYGFAGFTRPAAFQATTSLTEVNVNLRLYVWDIASTAILQHPYTGIGLGNFQILFERGRQSNMSAENGVYDDPHNYFLHLGATGGFPLLGAFLLLLSFCIFAAYKTLRFSKDPLMLGIVCGIVAFGVAASFTPVALPCLLCLGVLLAGSVSGRLTYVTFTWPKVVNLAGAALGVAFVIAGLCFVSAEYLFSKSYNNYFAQNYQKSYELASWAIRLNPTNQYYYIYRAGSAAYLSKPAQVSSDVDRIIRMQPQDAKSYVSAGNVYFSLFAITREKQYLDKSLDLLTQALPLDRLLAPRYAFVGYLQYLEANFDVALEYTKGSLQLNPKQIPAWMLLARIYQVENKRPQMLYALTEAKKLDPTSEVLTYIYNTAEAEQDVARVIIPVAILPGNLE